MIPLKKIFPVIVILITLSLLGIIYIQVSWIISAVHIKQDQLFQRAVSMSRDVYNDMMYRRQAAIMFKLDNKEGTATKGFNLDINRVPQYSVPSVSDFFTVQEVKRCIQNNMRKNHLDSSSFEFAIIGTVPGSEFGTIRMQSAGFEKMFQQNEADSIKEKKDYRVQVILLSESNDFNPRAEKLYIIMPNDDSVAKQLGIMISGGVLFTMIIITAFALTIRTLLNQKKLSEIKSDFINNMTHELKTPLATISLAIDAIRNEKVMSKPEKIQYFSGIIKEENKRMNKQVESILQSALLEKDEIALKLQATDVHNVIQSTADNLQLQLATKNGVVDLQLDAINPIIMADDVHFSNLIFNLMDNAIKYSNDQLEIRIQTYNTRKSLFIVIADNGIGMSRDTISRIFEKFYRAHTGNVHNVKGFGLGLTYVKAIVDAHKGKIKVESVVGKGSKFTLEFPQELDKG
ncbi:two-component system, OmpR family, phosphate regulon sensor histidine kinase PhoR [Chitinophaga ginsengisegetis]|uniref:histidine kinase n=1 Tax=Chitinophaga ginsengisegetis TaxID=393003 RepID=A0A1T5NMX4_9BACT|nr:HAMP domain-containing sensor histidine kinase [Chitinophaga ginsengisegetis]MDR6565398.1 two-component system phosphate regulon sensor histidine kinase PhoR [Chitinophaga ginsengisegetis]MDR6645126.1 two-component system phosphate regulon sensor histidine kinase PhoR [Chitinophaga ginsengisegetis]MDR6652282.1 two-component system phosphate regulon sensor histidine kinase PhoR [Chitinophaga ginsengisegetis]SKD01707.1 two-component system, OmpR family, phosphate regulon sensor histidine kinas